MKNLLLSAAFCLSLTQASAQEPQLMEGAAELRDEISKFVAGGTPTIFYTEGQKEYVFSVYKGRKSPNKNQNQRLVLHAGDELAFTYGDSTYTPIYMSEKDYNVVFSLPPIDGLEMLPLLLAQASHERINMKKLQEMNASLVVTGDDKSCFGFVPPSPASANEADSVKVCMHYPYEGALLKTFDNSEKWCYKNYSTLSDSKGTYRLEHWFEPEELGFVKFLLTQPDGEEWSIELVGVAVTD